MSKQRYANEKSALRAVIDALRRIVAGRRPDFSLPAGVVLPTTSLPPAFTPRQRAVVNAFFGSR